MGHPIDSPRRHESGVSPEDGLPTGTAKGGTADAAEDETLPSEGTGGNEPTPATGSGVSASPEVVRPQARTRVSAAWVGIVAAGIVLVLLLIFILQNTQSVRVTFFTLHGRTPLGVALLLAAVGGLLVAGLVGTLRILQLRRRAR
jgi:lipopolysaccharide assembly protein A